MTNFLLSIILLVNIFILIYVFVSGRNHLLSTLLTLEGIMLMIFGMLAFFSFTAFSFNSFLLIFLTFVACEGALALSLLVVAIRWWGSDRLMALTCLQGNYVKIWGCND